MPSSCGSRGAIPWSTRFRRRRSPATIVSAGEPASDGWRNTLGSRHERERYPIRARRRSVPGRATRDWVSTGAGRGYVHATGHGEGGPASKRVIVGYGFWIFLLSDIVMFSAF